MFSKAILVSFVTLFSTISEGKEAMKYDISVKDHAAQPALVIKGKIAVEKAGNAIGGSIGTISTTLTCFCHDLTNRHCNTWDIRPLGIVANHIHLILIYAVCFRNGA